MSSLMFQLVLSFKPLNFHIAGQELRIPKTICKCDLTFRDNLLVLELLVDFEMGEVT